MVEKLLCKSSLLNFSLVLQNLDMPCLQTVKIQIKANWSGSILFVIEYVNLYQQPGSSNLIGWKLEVGLAAKCIQHGKG